MSRPRVVIDATTNPRLARDLAAGGAFVTGYDLALSQECELIVRNVDIEIRLDARVVYVDPQQGAGLELVGFCGAIRDQLATLIAGPDLAVAATRLRRSPSSSSPPTQRTPLGSTPPANTPLVVRVRTPSDAPPTGVPIGRAPTPTSPRTPSNPDDQDNPDHPGNQDTQDAPDNPDTLDNPDNLDNLDNLDAQDRGDKPDTETPRTLHARLRCLNFAEQIKLAGAGDLNERILLERLYGKNVWEPLLRNPRLTPPEVARISRMGALPRVILEIIVGNASWLQLPDVRRALLSNPRLGPDQITKILRLMPKSELRLVPTQTALPFGVRDVARRLLRGEG